MNFIEYKHYDAINLDKCTAILKRDSKEEPLYFITFITNSDTIWWKFDTLSERNDILSHIKKKYVTNFNSLSQDFTSVQEFNELIND